MALLPSGTRKGAWWVVFPLSLVTCISRLVDSRVRGPNYSFTNAWDIKAEKSPGLTIGLMLHVSGNLVRLGTQGDSTSRGLSP